MHVSVALGALGAVTCPIAAFQLFEFGTARRTPLLPVFLLVQHAARLLTSPALHPLCLLVAPCLLLPGKHDVLIVPRRGAVAPFFSAAAQGPRGVG